MSRRTLSVATLAFGLLALPAVADGITVMDPYARAASPSAKAGAAFMMLKNETGIDDTLIEARTEAAKRVELHTHIDNGEGVMQMSEIEGGIALASGAEHRLVRGGDHVMLMGLTGPLEQGNEIEIILVFENADEIAVMVPVDNERKPASGTHGGHSN